MQNAEKRAKHWLEVNPILSFCSQINPNESFHHIDANLVLFGRKLNLGLPLTSEKSIHYKFKALLMLVKEINEKHAKSHLKCNLDQKLDMLFDISACSGNLKTLPCNNRLINSTLENCQQELKYCSG